MSDIKYRINLGNCQNPLTGDLVDPNVSIKWSSTQFTFDSTIITLDNA